MKGGNDRMKNKLYLLLITVMACFALSACGDSDEGTKEMKTYEYDNSGDEKWKSEYKSFCSRK